MCNILLYFLIHVVYWSLLLEIQKLSETQIVEKGGLGSANNNFPKIAYYLLIVEGHFLKIHFHEGNILGLG